MTNVQATCILLCNLYSVLFYLLFYFAQKILLSAFLLYVATNIFIVTCTCEIVAK